MQLLCCFGDARARRSRHRRGQHADGAPQAEPSKPVVLTQAVLNGHQQQLQLQQQAAPNGHADAALVQIHSARVSAAGDADEFLSCRDDFSVTDGAHLECQSLPHTPRHSGTLPTLAGSGRHRPPTTEQVHVQGIPHQSAPQPIPLQGIAAQQAAATSSAAAAPYRPAALSAAQHAVVVQEPVLHQQVAVQIVRPPQARPEDVVLQGNSETESDLGPEEPSKQGVLGGCLALLAEGGNQSGRQALGARSLKIRPGEKPEAGSTLQRRDMSKSVMELSYSYEDASDSRFRLRSLDYMRTKIKDEATGAMYHLVAADIFAFPNKQYHIAKMMQLPAAGPPVMAGDVALPPLLIFNLQLPLYTPSMWGANYDGPGVSIVFFFRLPDGFNPAAFPNQKALELYKRFIQNGREADGTPTRDRLKLIPRVVNVDEWVQRAPLSSMEAKALTTYNDKPVLTRPQHKFYHGRSYLEVDLDIHQYTYLARRAITTYLSRLHLVVWENAFVIQGNDRDELPEHLLAVSRVYRFDFEQAKPFPLSQPRSPAGVDSGAGYSPTASP